MSSTLKILGGLGRLPMYGLILTPLVRAITYLHKSGILEIAKVAQDCTINWHGVGSKWSYEPYEPFMIYRCLYSIKTQVGNVHPWHTIQNIVYRLYVMLKPLCCRDSSFLQLTPSQRDSTMDTSAGAGCLLNSLNFISILWQEQRKKKRKKRSSSWPHFSPNEVVTWFGFSMEKNKKNRARESQKTFFLVPQEAEDSWERRKNYKSFLTKKIETFFLEKEQSMLRGFWKK